MDGLTTGEEGMRGEEAGGGGGGEDWGLLMSSTSGVLKTKLRVKALWSGVVEFKRVESASAGLSFDSGISLLFLASVGNVIF